VGKKEKDKGEKRDRQVERKRRKGNEISCTVKSLLSA
jgi:hypothetical protein